MVASLLILLCLQDRPYRADPEMPAYTLPDVRAGADAADWRGRRRAELLELFRAHVYGRVSETPFESSFKVLREDRAAMGGTARLREVEVRISRGGRSLPIRVVLFTPGGAEKPSPAFLLICNRGVDNIDPTREKKSPFWPAEEGIARGYAMAAFHNADVDPDRHDGFKDGAHGLLDEGPRGPDAWGTIAAWAWGASRVMDYLVTVPEIAKDRIAVIGHSRGGKTALWAGAEDERFAMAVSNDSGCTGASLSRRRFQGKEQVARINQAFPHWFNARYKEYNGREDELPVDQHMLLALIAPRAVAVGSAEGDLWADPRGEFLAAVHAAPVYALLGRKGLGTTEMPPVGGTIDGDGQHYHLREGKHDLTLEDWKRYWDFADREFAGRK
jgi:hypothetical protein